MIVIVGERLFKHMRHCCELSVGRRIFPLTLSELATQLRLYRRCSSDLFLKDQFCCSYSVLAFPFCCTVHAQFST